MDSLENPNQYEIVEKDGKKFYKIPTIWTEKEYYSHDGPGWDYRGPYLEKKGFDQYDPNYLDKLSDDVYYTYEEVLEDN